VVTEKNVPYIDM